MLYTPSDLRASTSTVTPHHGASPSITAAPDCPWTCPTTASSARWAIRPAAPLPDPDQAIAAALAHPIGSPPLAEVARGRKNACILICDITRPVPNRLILPPLLRTLEEQGIARRDILILVATGLHRPNEGAELVELLGPTSPRITAFENHHGKVLAEHDFLGVTPERRAGLPRQPLRPRRLKITTGLIEPHLMAGYSGGRKVICPGIAALETVKVWHGPKFLEHPKADCGSSRATPFTRRTRASPRWRAVTSSSTSASTKSGASRGWAPGTWSGRWEAGVKFVEQVVRVPVPAPFDVVVTSGAGYPLDTTWYQAIKGLTGALPIVKQGGTIVLAVSLSEGLGSPEFQQIMTDNPDLKEFKKRILARTISSWISGN